MSIRIHKLAEELGLENKELLALLKERKIIAPDVKSVSSTVDNISASALREEFASRRVTDGSSTASTAAAGGDAPTTVTTTEAPPSVQAETPGAPKVVLPTGVFVKETNASYLTAKVRHTGHHLRLEVG